MSIIFKDYIDCWDYKIGKYILCIILPDNTIEQLYDNIFQLDLDKKLIVIKNPIINYQFIIFITNEDGVKKELYEEEYYNILKNETKQDISSKLYEDLNMYIEKICWNIVAAKENAINTTKEIIDIFKKLDIPLREPDTSEYESIYLESQCIEPELNRKYAMNWIMAMGSRQFQARLLYPIETYKIPEFEQEIIDPLAPCKLERIRNRKKFIMTENDFDIGRSNYAYEHRFRLAYMSKDEFIKNHYPIFPLENFK
jgi:hypothetical protein